jgi:hypothetical protein
MLKKPFSVLLLAAVIFNMTGFFIVFKIEQSIVRKNIKRQIKAGVPNSELHSFSMSMSDYDNLEWVKAEKEFKINNSMYDVVKSSKFKDSITLFCINDKQEEELFERLDQAVQNQMERESNAPNSPLNKGIKFLKLVYKIPKSEINLIGQPPFNQNYRTLVPHSYSSPFLEKDAPPPNSLS